MNIKNLTASRQFDGDILITATVDKSSPVQEILDQFEPNKFELTIEKRKKKRSIDANNYAWLLMGKLAQKLLTTPEQVYRSYIKDTGNYEILPIKNEAVEHWEKIWSAKGTGWICDSLGESKIKGYTNVRCFYGSSVYDSKEMSHLIDLIVQDCKEQGIETLSQSEADRMIKEWGKK